MDAQAVINMDAPYWTVPLHHRYLRLLAWFGANGSRLPTVADMPYLRMISGFDEPRIFYFIRDYSLAYSTTSRIQEADALNEGPQYMAARSLLLSQPIWSGLEPNADLTVQHGSEIQTEEGRVHPNLGQSPMFGILLGDHHYDIGHEVLNESIESPTNSDLELEAPARNCDVPRQSIESSYLPMPPASHHAPDSLQMAEPSMTGLESLPVPIPTDDFFGATRTAQESSGTTTTSVSIQQPPSNLESEAGKALLTSSSYRNYTDTQPRQVLGVTLDREMEMSIAQALSENCTKDAQLLLNVWSNPQPSVHQYQPPLERYSPTELRSHRPVASSSCLSSLYKERDRYGGGFPDCAVEIEKSPVGLRNESFVGKDDGMVVVIEDLESKNFTAAGKYPLIRPAISKLLVINQQSPTETEGSETERSIMEDNEGMVTSMQHGMLTTEDSESEFSKGRGKFLSLRPAIAEPVVVCPQSQMKTEGSDVDFYDMEESEEPLARTQDSTATTEVFKAESFLQGPTDIQMLEATSQFPMLVPQVSNQSSVLESVIAGDDVSDQMAIHYSGGGVEDAASIAAKTATVAAWYSVLDGDGDGEDDEENQESWGS